MNFARRLSRHQLHVLQNVARGWAKYRWSEAYGCWERYYKCHGGVLRWESHHTMLMTKTRVSMGGSRCGNHEGNSVVELVQRGLLVRGDGGKLEMSLAARREFGAPPLEVLPRRVVLMSRTRAARIQTP